MSAVTKGDDDAWTFQCPGVEGSPCGDPGGRAFSSSGWPTKALAKKRGDQHAADHAGEPMPELEDFRAEHGLTAHEDGLRAVKKGDDS